MGNGFKVCEHIKEDGIRCGSPALRGDRFCYYHFRMYDKSQLPGEQEYDPPVIDSYHGIQVMLMHVFRAYFIGSITDRQMNNLVNGLRLALKMQAKASTPKPESVCTEITSGMLDFVSVFGKSTHLIPESLLLNRPELDERAG